MYKSLRATKDAYISNRWIDGEQRLHANVGSAGSLDLYKLNGVVSGAVELTRLLIHFDLTDLRSMLARGSIDTSNPSFNCTLLLHDVYGGQPTPRGFDVSVFPLSASFDEGLGRDVVTLTDDHVCNWLTASSGATWFVSGCGLGGDDSGPCDYMTASTLVAGGSSLGSMQRFVTGEEDLYVDVTKTVSATLAGLVPDSGFRISFGVTEESDERTYFVKRFASRTAFNEALRPKLVVRYDDSVQDDTSAMYLDAQGYMFLYNYVCSAPANMSSGSTVVAGDDCLVLRLTTHVSGGDYVLSFTGSQHRSGQNVQPGIYSASVLVPSTDPVLVPQWQASGSLTFLPVWGSIDGTVAYLTGSHVRFELPQRGSWAQATRAFDVSVTGLCETVSADERRYLRVNIFDRTAASSLRWTRLPVETPGIVLRDVHFRVRDVLTRAVAVPFDTQYNSTRASSDSKGMYFVLDSSALTRGHTYVIDVMVVVGGSIQVYESASAQFRVAA